MNGNTRKKIKRTIRKQKAAIGSSRPVKTIKRGLAVAAALVAVSVAYRFAPPAAPETRTPEELAPPPAVYETAEIPPELEPLLNQDSGPGEDKEKKKGFLYSLRVFLLNLLAAVGRFFRKLIGKIFSPKNIWALVSFAIAFLIFLLKQLGRLGN